MGEEAGWREGFLFGLKKGATLATEIGFYQGYTTAWLTLLEKQEVGKAKKIQALRTLLEMAGSFPLEEQLLASTPGLDPSQQGFTSSDGSSMIARLAKIRSKFKQVQNLLTAASSGNYCTMPAGGYSERSTGGGGGPAPPPHVPPPGAAYSSSGYSGSGSGVPPSAQPSSYYYQQQQQHPYRSRSPAFGPREPRDTLPPDEMSF